LPNLEKKYYHTKLPNTDFVSAAKAHGWDGAKLKSNLSNLKEIMRKCYSPSDQSLLIEIPSDPNQIIGLNFRYENLRPKRAA
jgi:thiamine pyrophosphate-dependent acetolactate synthase large subunit-like protein